MPNPRIERKLRVRKKTELNKRIRTPLEIESNRPIDAIAKYLDSKVKLGELTNEDKLKILNELLQIKEKSDPRIVIDFLTIIFGNPNIEISELKRFLELYKLYPKLYGDILVVEIIRSLIIETNAFSNDYLFNRILNIIKGPFPEYKLKELYERIKNKTAEKNKYIASNGNECEYHEEIFTRTITEDNHKAWKKAYNSGLQVEEIINAEKEDNKIKIKSKVKGISLTKLINNLKYPFTRDQLISILRQIIITIRKLKDLEITHGHPHPGNWTIIFNNENPKVYLIDFKLAKPYSKDPKKRDHEIDISDSNLTETLFLLTNLISRKNQKLVDSVMNYIRLYQP